MADYIKGKSIIITGAAGGFGKLVSEKAAALGAKVTCADINEELLTAAVKSLKEAGYEAQAVATDVTDSDQMRALAAKAIETFGSIDVMINNAGTMPLAFFSDHDAAMPAWNRCIDINIKGVLNGISAVYDQMMKQGEGHVINISSIYGNHPLVGSGVYQATKTAVNYLSESLRVETRGKIKVTIIKPTGVPLTGLGSGIVNGEGVVGIVGQNVLEYGETMAKLGDGSIDPKLMDPEEMNYVALDPAFIADNVIYAINQPKGVSIGDLTVRASGDHYIL